jgi:hypothetical protein
VVSYYEQTYPAYKFRRLGTLDPSVLSLLGGLGTNNLTVEVDIAASHPVIESPPAVHLRQESPPPGGSYVTVTLLGPAP